MPARGCDRSVVGYAIIKKSFLTWCLGITLSLWQFWDSITQLVTSDTVAPTAGHRCDVSMQTTYCSKAEPRKLTPLLVKCFGVIPQV